MHDHGTESRGHLYSALLGATLPACALKQGFICFNLRRAEQTLTIGTCRDEQTLTIGFKIETN